MSRAVVEQVIGKLLMDPQFRKTFGSNATQALAGFDLTAEEREAFSHLDPECFETVANDLEPRISKVMVHFPVAQGPSPIGH